MARRFMFGPSRFFFGYRCNRICFMFFVGGSWQASSWLGWACFCYGCA